MWPNPQFPEDLVTFTEEILNWKIHFLCSETNGVRWFDTVHVVNPFTANVAPYRNY